MNAIAHRLIDVPAGRIHVAEQGSGPLVLLVHGFPECWYSWRHQLPAIADAGFHAVAVDARGYGRSSKPPALDAYRLLDLAEDIAGVITALGADGAVVVGHDWGSGIATTSALAHPDLVRAVGMLSVPYAPRGGPRPTRDLRAHRRAGGVLRELLPGAGARGGRDRAGRPRLARGLLRGALRRGRAAARRRQRVVRRGRREAARPVPRPGAAAGLAVRRTTSTCTRASSSGPASPAR